MADVGCGTGYGMTILREAGASVVVGVDISDKALAETKSHPTSGLHVCRADAQRLPLGDECFELITAFETIEHLEDDEGFLRETRRVLKQRGKLVVSTPKASPDRFERGRPKNPFHVREYSATEFQHLLESAFDEVELLGQRPRDAYSLCPVWDTPTVVSRKPAPLRRSMWRLGHRLPFTVKDSWSRVVHNRAFYPSEFDFTFQRASIQEGHVLVAICQK